jgi:hypothetical protein
MPALDLQIIGLNRLVPGLTAIGFYAAHFWQWARSGRLENILWACHIGCLLVGIGWLTNSPLLNGIGLLWLMPGIFFWLLYLVSGGVFLWSSLFIHIGGNLLGLWGAVLLGLPRGIWWMAGLGHIALLLVSRRFSRVSENVNFSRQVWTGWEKRFPSYPRYLSGLVLGAFVTFFALEQLLRLYLPPSK